MREALSSSTNMTAAQAAFAYILENQQIASCVFGTTKISNLLEVIDTVDKTLDKDLKLEIQKSFYDLQEKVSA
jgi:aryl-alcohol dehydrogenase-like predicted oxidoreductase